MKTVKAIVWTHVAVAAICTGVLILSKPLMALGIDVPTQAAAIASVLGIGG